ncbi:hypothetical protein OG453_22315 [Streptomyces sp. NBC_01381]|uniref:hypothetical protein n=1 Tax=Streptomyces sp. NBC_01381 TaxID=2903845 RepID=UPI002259B50A|nr:hypothetical protein [Streptomyces sp. NBC_01381]MCX4669377.1 hypothetical protein [Streptomyces sp. NBC_01381]
MSGDKESGGGAHVQIGSVTGGSLAFGAHGTAESTNYSVVTADPHHQHLLTQVRALRGVLPQAPERTPGEAALDAELDEVEREIGRSGRSDGRLLARLRDRLERYTAAAATAASVTAVLEAIAQITG